MKLLTLKEGTSESVIVFICRINLYLCKTLKLNHDSSSLYSHRSEIVLNKFLHYKHLCLRRVKFDSHLKLRSKNLEYEIEEAMKVKRLFSSL